MKKLLLCLSLIYKINSMDHNSEQKEFNEENSKINSKSLKLLQHQKEHNENCNREINDKLEHIKKLRILIKALIEIKKIDHPIFTNIFLSRIEEWRFDTEKKEKINILQKRLIEVTKKAYEEIKKEELKEYNDLKKIMENIYTKDFKQINEIIKKINIIMSQNSNTILCILKNKIYDNKKEFCIENLIDLIGQEKIEIVLNYMKNKEVIIDENTSVKEFHKIIRERTNIAIIQMNIKNILNEIIEYLSKEKDKIEKLNIEDLLKLRRKEQEDKNKREMEVNMQHMKHQEDIEKSITKLLEEQHECIKDNEKELDDQFKQIRFIGNLKKFGEWKLPDLLLDLFLNVDKNNLAIKKLDYIIENGKNIIKFQERILNIILEENTTIKEMKKEGKTIKDINNYIKLKNKNITTIIEEEEIFSKESKQKLTYVDEKLNEDSIKKNKIDYKTLERIDSTILSLVFKKKDYLEFNIKDFFTSIEVMILNTENFTYIEEDRKKLIHIYNIKIKASEIIKINIEKFTEIYIEKMQILLIQKEIQRIIKETIKYLNEKKEIVNDKDIKLIIKNIECLSNKKEKHDELRKICSTNDSYFRNLTIENEFKSVFNKISKSWEVICGEREE